MKSVLQFAAAVSAGLMAGMGSALAAPTFVVPEPGTLVLVGAAVGALVYISRKGKK